MHPSDMARVVPLQYMGRSCINVVGARLALYGVHLLDDSSETSALLFDFVLFLNSMTGWSFRKSGIWNIFSSHSTMICR